MKGQIFKFSFHDWKLSSHENNNNHNRWIGRDGLPRSLDLTPLDFFLWDYVKDRVFATPVNNILELRTQIRRDTIATVTGDILERTWQEVEYRLNIVRATNGAHVEVYVENKIYAEHPVYSSMTLIFWINITYIYLYTITIYYHNFLF